MVRAQIGGKSSFWNFLLFTTSTIEDSLQSFKCFFDILSGLISLCPLEFLLCGIRRSLKTMASTMVVLQNMDTRDLFYACSLLNAHAIVGMTFGFPLILFSVWLCGQLLFLWNLFSLLRSLSTYQVLPIWMAGPIIALLWSVFTGRIS